MQTLVQIDRFMYFLFQNPTPLSTERYMLYCTIISKWRKRQKQSDENFVKAKSV